MLLCSGFTMTAVQNNNINPPSSIEHEETTAEEEHFRIIRRKSVNLTEVLSMVLLMNPESSTGMLFVYVWCRI